MKYRHLSVALAAAVLLLGASHAFALEHEEAGETSKSTVQMKHVTVEPGAKRKFVPASKRVDINSAGKKQLKTLPGISDADVDKIIGGRPYLTKAELVSKEILSKDAYERISAQVVAKSNKASEAKLLELQKQRQTK